MNRTIFKFGKRALKSTAAPFYGAYTTGKRLLVNTTALNVAIFGYHRIVADIDQAENEAIYGLVTSAPTFRRQLQLIQNQYDIISLDEAVELLRGDTALRKSKRATAVITFDDGYRDVFDQAFPILKEFGVTATIFVVTSRVGAGKFLDHDMLYRAVVRTRQQGLSLNVPLIKAGLSHATATLCCLETDPIRICDRLVQLPSALRSKALYCLEDFLGGGIEYPIGFSTLDWDTIRKMSGAGISFGAHTDNHAILTQEDNPNNRREVLRSKEILEENLGLPVRHFAYPKGRYNDSIKSIVAAAGFDAALTTERRINSRGDDPYALGRISLCEESTRGANGRYSESVARMRIGF